MPTPRKLPRRIVPPPLYGEPGAQASIPGFGSTPAAAPARNYVRKAKRARRKLDRDAARWSREHGGAQLPRGKY